MPFDPSQPFEVVDEPPKKATPAPVASKPAFDPTKAFEPVDETPKPAFDPSQPAEEVTQPKPTVAELARHSSFDPAAHAATNPQDFDAAFEAYQARKARPASAKTGEFAETLIEPSTYVNAAKGVGNFLLGFPQVVSNTAQQGYFSATGDPRAQTKQAEATLTAQSGEESGKRMLDATVGRFAAGAAKLDDPDPARTAYRESYIRRNPAHLTPEQMEERKALWAKEDAADKVTRDTNIDRKVFEQRVQAAKNAQQLAEGRPLDTGIISKIYSAAGQTPSGQVGPEALAAQGAPKVDLGNIERMAAATDPNNIALSMAPGLPGAAKIAGAGTELAGKALQVPGKVISAIPGRLGRFSRGAAGGAAVVEAAMNPAAAATTAGTVAGAKGLQSLGRILAEQGKELRTGVPSQYTTKAATAAATGESALKANVARKIGDTVAHGAQTAVGMAPLNAALAEGDPKKLAESTVGAAAFGGTLQAFRNNRAALVEGVRPHLRSEGARALAEAGEGNDPLARKSAAYLFSLPEAARDTALEAIGALQGLPLVGKGGETKRAKVYVLSEPDYLAEDRRITPAAQSAMGGGRGFFYGPDGAAYINGDYHAGLGPNELAHTIGHEFGGHAAINIMKAASERGGALYRGLMDSAKASLMPNGKPTPAFKRFIENYNQAFDPAGKFQRISAQNPEAMEEFIAETAGHIMANRGPGELAVPKVIRDRIQDGIGRFMGQMLGFDSRTIGGKTNFDREEVGQLTQAVQETLGQIVGMKLREGGELPEAPKTTATRIGELQEVINTPRPPQTAPVTQMREWFQAQRDARAELEELTEGITEPFPATGTPPVAPSAPVAPPKPSFTNEPLQPILAPRTTTPNARPVSTQTPNEQVPRSPEVATQGAVAPATATATAERPTPAVAPGAPVAPKPVLTEAEVKAMVTNAEQAATAAEKKPQTVAAKSRIQAAKQKAILDAIGDDPTGLRRVVDDFGNTEIKGDFDPQNPLHRALVENLPPDEAAKVLQLQSAKGQPIYVRYRSALSSAEGEGGEGTMDTGMANRNAEYNVDPAQSRKEGTIQHKVVIPLETQATKGGSLTTRAFVPDNILHNAESIFEGLRQLGRPNPYGQTPAEQGPQLIADANAYALNHANGYRGDGSGPIAQFPDSGLPRPVEGYQPTQIPKERFDILNMAMHSEASSRLAQLEAAQQAAQAAGKPFPKSKVAQLAKSREAVNLARENQRFIDPLSGETNQLRAELRAAGFETSERFKSPFETLLPKHILEVSQSPIALQEGDIPSVRPTGLDVDPREVVRSGRPIDKAVAANFMPSTAAADIPNYDSLFHNRESRFDVDGVPYSAEVRQMDKTDGVYPVELMIENIRTGYGKEDDAFGVTGTMGTSGARKFLRESNTRLQSLLKALPGMFPDVVIVRSKDPTRSKLYERAFQAASRMFPGSKIGSKMEDGTTVFAYAKPSSSDRANAFWERNGF